jgi:glycosyltransferase involved in cell wall biosynthesis
MQARGVWWFSGRIPRQIFKVRAPGVSWICAQIGAREHYAVPRVLHRSGRLEALFTDYWSQGPWRALGSLAGGARLAGRWHPELSDAEAYGFNATAVLEGLRQRFLRGDAYLSFLRAGSAFGRHVRSAMSRRREQDWGNTVFFGYDTGFLEAAAWAKDRGAACVVCQMDPSQFEVELVRGEESRWPGWARAPLLVPEEYHAWRKAEWALADAVVVNSKWTRDALVDQGVPPEKIETIPLAYEPEPSRPDSPPPLPRPADAPLRVLFLGQVNLRKGVPYLLAAAKGLRGAPVKIDIVGPIALSDHAVVSAPPNVEFHGPVPRSRAADFFAAADVFVIPTVSDGFAITQLEAMAHGLPVISTPNCGEVVTDGLDGFVVPARDPAALANALRTLVDDPERLEAMGDAAREKVGKFSLDALDRNLRALERKAMGGRAGGESEPGEPFSA